MPMTFIGGLGKSGGAGCGPQCEPQKTDCRTRQRPCGVRYMRAFKCISRGADEIFMATNETGMPDGMPVVG
ncbi:MULTISPECIES: hypothetical protein [Stutzerimonas]|jgi:hypothetical protein|uniref:hypothetical protein n=1 Tax=Stutzerimonas TaxID=2901164 RepID=UPI000AB97272|nr:MULTISPECIES: hypothetical protein [Stutzerimonas stutzeri group]MBD3877157.1 hypothetical protein [Stutzerimonas kunmingensis]MCB4794821.1 hypothetical protein [Pseudomonas sp. NP21570]MCQ2036485.1 hypothetical protein [Stutzerimonas kunmingensis]UEG62482.1 hypothetical protein LLJ08_04885 [Stutzerimonas chloritidismutans]